MSPDRNKMFKNLYKIVKRKLLKRGLKHWCISINKLFCGRCYCYPFCRIKGFCSGCGANGAHTGNKDSSVTALLSKQQACLILRNQSGELLKGLVSMKEQSATGLV